MVQTQKLLYEVALRPAPSVTITTVVTNASPQVIFVPVHGAGLLALERQVGERWVIAAHPIHTLELREPLTIQPGRSTTDTVMLDLQSGVTPPQSPSQIPGRYRAVYAIFATWDSRRVGRAPGELVPQEDRTSNAFILQLAKPARE